MNFLHARHHFDFARVEIVGNSDAAKNGLPGEHHFKITFNTTAPDVRLSDRMRARYPQDMTIVLQHQFWDLGVTEQTFEVGLSFGGVPERVLVPFDAVTAFFDPAVQFGLQFETMEAQAEDASPAKEQEPAALLPAALARTLAGRWLPRRRRHRLSERCVGSNRSSVPSLNAG